jgi:hypothetical protein
MSAVYINQNGNLVGKPTYTYSLNEKLGIATLIKILRNEDTGDYTEEMNKINNVIEQGIHPSFLVTYIESLNLFNPDCFLWIAFKINRNPIAYKCKTASDCDTKSSCIEENTHCSNIPQNEIKTWATQVPDWA